MKTCKTEPYITIFVLLALLVFVFFAISAIRGGLEESRKSIEACTALNLKYDQKVRVAGKFYEDVVMVVENVRHHTVVVRMFNSSEEMEFLCTDVLRE